MHLGISHAKAFNWSILLRHCSCIFNSSVRLEQAMIAILRGVCRQSTMMSRSNKIRQKISSRRSDDSHVLLIMIALHLLCQDIGTTAATWDMHDTYEDLKQAEGSKGALSMHPYVAKMFWAILVSYGSNVPSSVHQLRLYLCTPFIVQFIYELPKYEAEPESAIV